MKNISRGLGWPVFFVLVSCLYYFEAFSQGILLAASDDAIRYFYPSGVLLNNALKSWDLPLWNPYMFSGMPFMGAHQTAVLYPPSFFLNLLLSPEAAFNASFIGHHALAAYLAFYYIRRLTGSTAIGVFAGVSYGFVGFINVVPDHINIMRASAWLPLMVLLAEDLSGERPMRSALLLSVITALQFLAGSPQVVVYSHMLLLFPIGYGAFRSGAQGRRRVLGAYALSLVLGGLLALPQLMATLELSSLAWRVSASYEFFASFPLRFTAWDLFLPWTGKSGNYAYMGVVTLITGIAAIVLLVRNDARVRLWTACAFVFLLLALGDRTPLYRIMFNVPVYNMFRASERHMLDVYFAFIVLASLGLRDFIEGRRRAYVAVIALAPVLVALMPVFLGHPPSLEADGTEYFTKGLIGALAVSLAYAFTAASLSRYGRGKLVSAVIVALVMVEAFASRPDLVKESQFSQYTLLRRPDTVLEPALKAQPGRIAFYTHYGVLGLAAGAPALKGVGTLGGYDTLMPGQYNRMLGMFGSGRLEKEDIERLISGNTMLSMFNALYVIACNEDRELASGETYMRLFDMDDICTFYVNRNSLPRVYPVTHALEAGSIETVRGMIESGGFDPRRDVALSAKDISGLGREEFSAGKASIVGYGMDEVEIEAEFNAPGLVVLADQFYPGWRAYIDGSEVPVLRANGILRATPVPAGRYRLIYRYEPWYIMPSILVSISVLAGILFLLSRRGSVGNVEEINEARGRRAGNARGNKGGRKRR